MFGPSGNVFQKRLLLFELALGGLLLILFGRLWFLQITQADYYREKAEQNRLRIIQLPAPRGLIMDRRGRLLVDNEISFSLVLRREYMKDRQTLLRVLRERFGLEPAYVNRKLEEYRRVPTVFPIVLKNRLSFAEIAFTEAHFERFPELTLEWVPTRRYLLGPMASHLNGYVGEVTPEELKQAAFASRTPGDIIGKTGLERYYDSILDGDKGQQKVFINSIGQITQVHRFEQRERHARDRPDREDRPHAPMRDRAAQPGQIEDLALEGDQTRARLGGQRLRQEQRHRREVRNRDRGANPCGRRVADVREQAPGDRSDDEAESEGGADQPHRLATLGMVGHIGDVGLCNVDVAAGQPVDDTAQEQQRERVRERKDHEPDSRAENRKQQDRLAPVSVGQPTEQRRSHQLRERVGGDKQTDLELRGARLVGQVRQQRDDDAEGQHVHEHDDEYDQQMAVLHGSIIGVDRPYGAAHGR